MQAGPTRAPTPEKEKQSSPIKKFFASIWTRLKRLWSRFTGLFSKFSAKNNTDQQAPVKSQTESQERHLDSLKEEREEVVRRALAKANEAAQTEIQQAEAYCNDRNLPIDILIMSQMKVLIGQITNRNEKDAQKITEWTQALRQENDKAKAAQAAKKEAVAKAPESSVQPNPPLISSSPQLSEEAERLNMLKQKLKISMEVSYRDTLKDAQKLIGDQFVEIPANFKQELQERIQKCTQIIEGDDAQTKAAELSQLKGVMGAINDYLSIKKDTDSAYKGSEKAREIRSEYNGYSLLPQLNPSSNEQSLPEQESVAVIQPSVPVEQPSEIDLKKAAIQKEKEEEQSIQEGLRQKEAAIRAKIERWKETVLKDLRLLNNKNKSGDLPLTWAIKSEDLEIVQWILNLHADKESEGSFLRTLLGHLDEDPQSDHSSALIWAAKINDLNIIKVLLKSLLKTPKESIVYLISLEDIKQIYHYKNGKRDSFSTIFTANHPDKEALKKADPELVELLDRADYIGSLSLEKPKAPAVLNLTFPSVKSAPAVEEPKIEQPLSSSESSKKTSPK